MISALLLLCIVVVIVSAHFSFAVREWRRTRRRDSVEISSVESSTESAERVFRQQAVLTRGTPESDCSYAAGTMLDAAVTVRGDFECAGGCRFTERINATGHASVGEESELRELAAQGGVRVGRGVRIKGSLHAAGPVTVEGGCTVGRYVTSHAEIWFRGDFAATAIVSPAIATSHDDPSSGHEKGEAARHPSKAGVTGRWFTGAYEPPTAVIIDSPLVVEGPCTLPAGSEVNADLRVKGAALIGAGSLIRGSIVCDGDLHVEDDCRFQQVLVARGDLRLGARVMGARVTGCDPERPVAAYAEGEMVLGSDSFFSGRLYAAQGIRFGDRRLRPAARPPRLGAGLRRLTKLLGAATLLCTGISAQTDTPSVRVEVAGHVIGGNAVPTASGGEVSVGYTGVQKIRPTLLYEAYAVNGGRQDNVALMAVIDWTPRVFTNFGFSKSQVESGAPALFPSWRADAQVLWKPVPTGWIIGAGTIAIRYRASSADLLTLTVVRYLPKWVLQADGYVNRSQPGDFWSGSGLISAETGRYGRQQVRFRAGAGHEAYRMSIGNPAQFRYGSYSFDVLYRKWLSPRYGVSLRAADWELRSIGRRVDAAFGLFFEL